MFGGPYVARGPDVAQAWFKMNYLRLFTEYWNTSAISGFGGSAIDTNGTNAAAVAAAAAATAAAAAGLYPRSNVYEYSSTVAAPQLPRWRKSCQTVTKTAAHYFLEIIWPEQ